MFKRICFFLILALGFNSVVYSYELLNTEQLVLGLDTYLRTDLVSLKNVVGLNSHDLNSQTTYLGIDYSFAFSGELKDSGSKFYLKLERNGPYDYDAPLFIHHTLNTSGANVEKYRNAELAPQVEEFWLDAKLGSNFGLKAGMFI